MLRRHRFFALQILVFPFTSCFYFTLTALCDCIDIRPLVEFILLEQSFLDEVVEIRIEAAVVDLLLVIVVAFVLDCEPVWFLEPRGYLQDVPLDPVRSCICLFPVFEGWHMLSLVLQGGFGITGPESLVKNFEALYNGQEKSAMECLT